MPDWLSDLFTDKPGVPPQLVKASARYREVIIPQQYVARLIGRGGEVIMGIVNQTGADVKIRQETKDLGYSLAVITGSQETMQAAENLVRQKLGLPGTGYASKELPLSTEQASILLRNQGSQLAGIRLRAGGLQVEIRGPLGPGLPHHAVLGPGPQEQLLVAEQLITVCLAEALASAKAR